VSFLLGMTVGTIAIDLLWRLKIREKAATGFRLHVLGKLYRVTEDDPQ